MNPGAQVHVTKAREVGLRIAQWRSEGLKYSEIGKILGISPEAAKQRFWRYKKHLRATEGKPTIKEEQNES